MGNKFKPQEGSCSCYSNTYTITSQPIARFICHCTICQEFTGADFNDVTVLLKSDVTEVNLIKTNFRRWKMPPNVKRGLCTRCNKPSIEMAVGGALLLIPTENYPDVAALPDPSMHLFYNRRVEDIDDNLPKYNGFLQSQTMMLKALIKGIYKRVKR